MTTTAEQLTTIFQNWHQQTIMLTPNQRLSAVLHKQYEVYALQNNFVTWSTPTILPLQTWLQYLWREYTLNSISSAKLLLNANQEIYLWEKIIKATPLPIPLLQAAETATLAKSAWSLLSQWQIPINDASLQVTESGQVLANWFTAFAAKCHADGLIDFASVIDFLIQHISKLSLPKKIIFFGFTDIVPQIKNFIRNCEQVGCEIFYLQSQHKSVQAVRTSLDDDEAEIIAAARWAKQLHQANPQNKIACVFPTLDKIRDRVTQLFAAVFAQENNFTTSTTDAPFNVSAGKNLQQYPVVNAALQILALHKKKLSIELFNYALNSPFAAHAEKERLQRAQFDKWLRKANAHFINPRLLLDAKKNRHHLALQQYCPLFAKSFSNFFTFLDQYKNQQLSFRVWGDIFNDALAVFGWPGERSLNSEEYQVVEQWRELLLTLQTLDQVATPVHYHEALQTLHRLATRKIFQPQTPDAPIQILGLLEAAGMPFDYIWLTGVDDITWPPQPSPHPLLPKNLQRRWQMPHATAERELLYCKQLLAQFSNNCQQIIFSHAEKKAELACQVSPLIRDVDFMPLQDLPLATYDDAIKKIYASRRIEIFSDDMGPALQPNEKIRGGINVIKHQAMCPFRAFSQWRLHAQELDSTLPGLRAHERGTILHKALEIIWNQIKDHATLVAIASADLQICIRAAIEEAMQANASEQTYAVQYLTLEKQRLQNLLTDWLALEKKRQPFTVKNNEASAQITLNQLTLSLRIDRIDELHGEHHGKKLIIDYKTGRNNEISRFFGERPDEPQLPLYCLLDQAGTAGVAFAQLAPGGLEFKGMSYAALEIKGIKVIHDIKKIAAQTWSEQLADWQNTFTKLSDDFANGQACVNPKDGNQTCLWCALQPLCRVHEQTVNESSHASK